MTDDDVKNSRTLFDIWREKVAEAVLRKLISGRIIVKVSWLMSFEDVKDTDESLLVYH